MLVETTDDRRMLIDGGKNEAALSYLKWKYHLKKYEKIFDAVILTHGDEDHSKGLISILNDEKVLVKSIYHNGIALRKGGSLGGLSDDGDYVVELYDDTEELRPIYDDLSPLYKKWVDAVASARKRVDDYNKRPEGERLGKIDFKCVRADHRTGKVAIGDAGVEVTFVGPINHGTDASPRLLGAVLFPQLSRKVRIRNKIVPCVGVSREPKEEIISHSKPSHGDSDNSL